MNVKRLVLLLILAAVPLISLVSTNILLHGVVNHVRESNTEEKNNEKPFSGAGREAIREKDNGRLAQDPGAFNIMKHDQFTMTGEQFHWDWDRLRSSINAGESGEEVLEKTEADIEKTVNLYNIRIETLDRQIKELRQLAPADETVKQEIARREENLTLMKATLEVLKKQCIR